MSTSSFSNSLFTISETGDLSLLGLHFDNLNPSSTNALMSITSSDNTQQANITIIDCEFNQDSSSYSSSSSSSSLSHSIISINGGQMRYGAAFNAQLQSGNQLKINNSEFIQCNGSSNGECKASEQGGGIRVNIYDANCQLTLEDGVKFEDCISNYIGGGMHIYIYEQGTSIINKVQFKDCKAYFGGGVAQGASGQTKQIFNGIQFHNCEALISGGGMEDSLHGENSILELIDVIFENCTSGSQGGGLNIIIYEGQFITQGACSVMNCSSDCRQSRNNRS
ncbi:MAG: hypothetical protein EZS28_029128 [Streblomastix strix]|uniref:Right handed beta helix domain-containing protein n=1 Tax=Streblomastix strix TaxID=222440 RepID=A0A5J4UXA7_9EUKA|nr:MAG: hypothetical protein EZS28_029128 [Streblomastix strix]